MFFLSISHGYLKIFLLSYMSKSPHWPPKFTVNIPRAIIIHVVNLSVCQFEIFPLPLEECCTSDSRNLPWGKFKKYVILSKEDHFLEK